MKNREYLDSKHRQHHPAVSFGLFLIALGVALLVATNDLLHLGSVSAYFTWETVLVFIGFVMILNLRFVGGVILIALGSWFFLDNHDYELPHLLRTFYWPGVLILIGLGFIFSSLFRKKGISN